MPDQPGLSGNLFPRARPFWLSLYAVYLLWFGLLGAALAVGALNHHLWGLAVMLASPALLALLGGVGLLRLKYWGLACALLLMLLHITVTVLNTLGGVRTSPVQALLLPLVTAVVLLAVRQQRDLLD